MQCTREYCDHGMVSFGLLANLGASSLCFETFMPPRHNADHHQPHLDEDEHYRVLKEAGASYRS